MQEESRYSWRWIKSLGTAFILYRIVWHIFIPKWEMNSASPFEKAAIMNYFQENFSSIDMGITEPVSEWKITEVYELQRNPKQVFEDGRSAIRKNRFKLKGKFLMPGQSDWEQAGKFTIKKTLKLEKHGYGKIRVKILEDGEL